MWYIFKDNVCLASCDFEPNQEDLQIRGEFALEYNERYDLENITHDGNKNVVLKPPIVPTFDEAKANKLNELNKAATAAYLSGFQSNASGNPLWYDSDVDTQNVINRQFLFALANPTLYNATQFFEGVPVGVTPVRARPQKTEPDSAKTVQFINANQMVQLSNDMAVAWAAVKATLWQLQSKVYAAMSKGDIAAIVWPQE